jgi:solute carrier family 35 protein
MLKLRVGNDGGNQMILSTVVLYVLRKLNLIKFSDDSADGKTAVKHFVPVRVLRQISPLSIAYLFYMVVGMASIRGVNVPMYTTLRRTTVFFTIIMEFLLVGQKHSNPIIASVAIIVLGAFVAGSRDLSFELEGYSTVLLSNITTAIYLATIARLGKTTGLNSFGLMWCNGLICGPILILWTLLSGELNMAINFESLHVLGFQVCTGLLVLVSESTHRYPTHRRRIIVEFHSQVDLFYMVKSIV